MKNLFLFLLLSSTLGAQDTLNILHYTETTGFDHNTRNESRAMFQRICDSLTWQTPHEWILTHRNSSELFDTLSKLEQYDVVIWSNTSGDAGLTADQRSNYEMYVTNGGSYLGIHAASDTYRHSSANGGRTGSWDFYAEHLSGCSVQQSPNHTSANHNNFMDHETDHPILEDLPDPWNKTEEYYYWENGYVDTSFHSLLSVRRTGGNSYDSSRMMAQYRELPTGGRSFYTALGHARSNFTEPNNEFEILNRNALYWLADPKISTGYVKREHGQIELFPNPAQDHVLITLRSGQSADLSITDMAGQTFKSMSLSGERNFIDVSEWPRGMYIFNVSDPFGRVKSEVLILE